MNGYIYKITNKVNNKIYIGQTRVNIEIRWKEHIRHSKYSKMLIHKAINKYGYNNFSIECLEICSLEDLDYKEEYYINIYNSTNKTIGYNVSLGGSTPKYLSNNLPLEIISTMYKLNYTLEQIASIFNTTRYKITTLLVNNNISIRDRHDSASKCNKLSKEAVIKTLNKTASLRKAASYLGIPYSTFRNACNYYNIEYNLSKSARH